MLELRPCCEICKADLLPDSTAARICSFECTFCADCAASALHDVCPNCGGGLVPRPIRPRAMLARHPASTEQIVKPLDPAKHAELLARYCDVCPTRGDQRRWHSRSVSSIAAWRLWLDTASPTRNS